MSMIKGMFSVPSGIAVLFIRNNRWTQFFEAGAVVRCHDCTKLWVR
jgi:hypothetical protein